MYVLSVNASQQRERGLWEHILRIITAEPLASFPGLPSSSHTAWVWDTSVSRFLNQHFYTITTGCILHEKCQVIRPRNLQSLNCAIGIFIIFMLTEEIKNVDNPDPNSLLLCGFRMRHLLWYFEVVYFVWQIVNKHRKWEFNQRAQQHICGFQVLAHSWNQLWRRRIN